MQLVVGRVTRPHGVRGEVSVEVRTDDPDLRFAVGRVMATDPAAAGPLTVESVRWHSGRLLIRFAGIADRNQAEELRGTWLTLDSAEVGPTGDPDEFHDHELIGLAVVTTSGQPVGRVTDVRHFGQDLLVIEPAPARSPAGPEAGQAETGAAEVGPSPDGPSPTGPAQGRARAAPRWRPGRSPATCWAANCWSRSSPHSCLRSTWLRDGSSSTPRPGCWNWAPGTPVRPAPVRRHRPGARQAPARQAPARQAPARQARVPREAEASPVRIDVITIFPDYFAPLSVSLLGKAASRGDIELQVHDLRNWAHGVHRAVDDAPFGGGPGMVMSPEPWGEALDEVAGPGPAPARLVVPTPSGLPFTRRWRRNGPVAAGWFLLVAGTRESTRASWTRRATGCRSMKCPSGTTCCPGGARRAGDGGRGRPPAARCPRQRRVRR